MSESRFIDGDLHAPYFIFLRGVGKLSDAELLDRFGLAGYRRTTDDERLRRCVIMADDGQWIMLADDWYYTLWHLKTTRPALAALAQSVDVFACSVGDCDHAYDFIYYRDGQLVRHVVVEDPSFQHGEVVEDVGEPLPGEAAAFQHTDELKIVLTIAASLGIKIHYAAQEIRIYSPDSVQ